MAGDQQLRVDSAAVALDSGTDASPSCATVTTGEATLPIAVSTNQHAGGGSELFPPRMSTQTFVNKNVSSHNDGSVVPEGPREPEISDRVIENNPSAKIFGWTKSKNLNLQVRDDSATSN